MKKILLVLISLLFVFWIANATWDTEVIISLKDRLDFFWILVPAAIWDSINPCAFAVMFILLSSILREQWNKKTVILAWALFTLSVFISYMAMWLGLYRALATTDSVFYLKLVVWILWVFIWLANLKDYFWYGKLFKMEVPDSWRPKMRNLLKKVIPEIF